MSLSTVNDAGLDCLITFTLTWGDGTGPSTVVVPPNSEVQADHTYTAVGHYAAHAAASVDPDDSDPDCLTVPGGWDHHPEFEVLPQLKATLTLHDIDGEPLEYLSTDQHPYFNGFTRIHGRIAVTGAPQDRLSFLFLELSRGDVDAFAFLTPDASARLVGVKFGADRRVRINASQLLFELSAGQAAVFADDTNGPVSLRLVGATSFDGAQLNEDLPDTPRLVRYKRLNRYQQRDPARGGDDWVLPSVRPVLVGLSITFPALRYGDISNMNGGSFNPPHKSHRDGVDVDVKFPGYDSRNTQVAKRLIDHLNDPVFGTRIKRVWVTYNRPGSPLHFPGRPDPDPIWTAIKDVVLNDGRHARKVIKPAEGHDTHFHWQITP